jgi:hypothetical protein
MFRRSDIVFSLITLKVVFLVHTPYRIYMSMVFSPNFLALMINRLRTGLPDCSFSNQKIPIWVNFGGCCDGRYILWPFALGILWPSGIFYGFLLYLWVNWYILPVLVSSSKKKYVNPG